MACAWATCSTRATAISTRTSSTIRAFPVKRRAWSRPAARSSRCVRKWADPSRASTASGSRRWTTCRSSSAKPISPSCASCARPSTRAASAIPARSSPRARPAARAASPTARIPWKRRGSPSASSGAGTNQVPAPLVDTLRGIVGAAHVLTGADCAPYIVDGRTPDAVVVPGTKEEVAAVVVAAAEAGVPILPWGGGTRMSLGAPPPRLGVVLVLRRLNKLIEHEPGDLTTTAEAGITMTALQGELGKRGQWLSLDPAQADKATLGGVLSSNDAGPRRHLYGSCRDLLIGLTVITASGATVKGGGKVVKNVAGYDLPKLFIGAFGTLGVIVEATVKLRPRPDADRLVIVRFGHLKEAGAAARAVMSSDLLPSALDLVDAEACKSLGQPGEAALLIGVDGIPEQVEWQCAEAERLLRPQGLVDARVLDGGARDAMW